MTVCRDVEKKAPAIDLVILRSRELEGLEVALESCQNALAERNYPVNIITPAFEHGKPVYAALVFNASGRFIYRLRKEVCKIGVDTGTPGTVPLYKSYELDSYYTLEIKPFAAGDRKDLIKKSEIIARHLAQVLRGFCRFQKF